MELRVPAAAVAALSITAVAFAQAPDPRPGASTPVQVMNTTSNPVPVQIQGTGSITGTVTVTNSPESPLSVSGAIDTHAADTTDTLYQNTLTVNTPNAGNHSTGVIDTKNYKSVRIIVQRGSCGPCGDPVQVYVQAHAPTSAFPLSGTIDSFQLTTPGLGIALVATRVYDVPGEGISIWLENPGSGFSNSVGILVFGRRN